MTEAQTAARQRWMGVLARASRAELEEALAGLTDLPTEAAQGGGSI
jgi:alpha-D-ribose 1-methylphosphonate 5-triphosphate synthase subunit PhnG